MEMLLEGQLDAAEVILINKIDLVDQDTLETVENSIRSFNGDAQFFTISATQTIDPNIFNAMLGAEQERTTL
jgi:G3E family GTPase